MKVCTKCETEKPLDQFCRDKNSNDGHQKWCKHCQKEYRAANAEHARQYQKKYRDDNVLQLREFRLKKFFGLTLDDYWEMLDMQGGGCAICGTSLDHSGHVDHCHKTGMIRGVLCSCCNTAIGKFRDDIELLDNAISYLMYHKSRGAEWQTQTSNL